MLDFRCDDPFLECCHAYRKLCDLDALVKRLKYEKAVLTNELQQCKQRLKQLEEQNNEKD